MLLEHDRWKLETQHAHEVRLEELRLSARRTPGAPRAANEESISVTEEDKKFNTLTSYGTCTDRHLGLIAKTKVWEGAAARSGALFDRWYEHIQQNNVIPLKDLKEGRIKSLLLVFLWASGCSHRAARWPDAGDLSAVMSSIRKELQVRFSKFSKHSIVAAYESLKVFWKEINDYELCSFNSSLIADILDEAYEYVNTQNEKESKVDIKKSPLFSEFEKQFPHVPLDVLEKYYIKNRYRFVAGGIGALRKYFTTTVPAELEHNIPQSDWPKQWHQYIHNYEPTWQKQLTQILQTTKEAQEKWKEG
jgi:hypothetical protein